VAGFSNVCALIQGFYFLIPKENAMKTYLREALLLSTTVLALAAGQADAAALNFDDGMADTSVAGFYTDLLFTDATFTDSFGLVGSSGSLGIFSSSGAYHWSAANPISIAFANPIPPLGLVWSILAITALPCRLMTHRTPCWAVPPLSGSAMVMRNTKCFL
jgi:hypothetical protein